MLKKITPESLDLIYKLKALGGFWYVATPYSKHPKGIYIAFEEAADITAWLLSFGLPVYSPIVHGHVLCSGGDLNPVDHDFWMKVDTPFMNAASGLIVIKMDGYKESLGVLSEIKHFEDQGKAVLFLDPRDHTITFSDDEISVSKDKLH